MHRGDREPGGACLRGVQDHRGPPGLPGAQQLQRRPGGGQRHQLGARLQAGPHLRGE